MTSDSTQPTNTDSDAEHSLSADPANDRAQQRRNRLYGRPDMGSQELPPTMPVNPNHTAT